MRPGVWRAPAERAVIKGVRRAKLFVFLRLHRYELHALAHIGHWQGRRARYRGSRKNLFDLRRVAVVHNLHIIARQDTATSYELAA